MSAVKAAYEEFRSRIDTEMGLSDWITVDQTMIDQFAETTHDTQWIHTDPERAAKETPFGGTIAHGFLTLSLASRFAYDCFPLLPGQVMGINYGMNKLRFLMPVRAGSRLRGRFVLKDVKIRNETSLMRENRLTIEIDGQDTPALVADWLGLAVFEN